MQVIILYPAGCKSSPEGIPIFSVASFHDDCFCFLSIRNIFLYNVLHPFRRFGFEAADFDRLAGLMAEGETLLSDPSGHIERGYQNLPEKLRLLGADIERLDDYPV